MRIIPAIDLIDGKCVRLEKGDFDKKTIYREDPLEVAKEFEDHGIQYLHLVDLDGAKSGKVVNYKILEKIASKTGLIIDFGGGIRSEDDVEIVLDSGAEQVVIGSLAFKEPYTFFGIMEVFGEENIILGADARKGKIAVGGWQESTDMDVKKVVLDYYNSRVQYVLCTDIDKDGMMAGPATKLYQSILKQVPYINLLASGGIRNMDDVEEIARIGCEGVIIGKAIYENAITLKDLENYVE